MNPDRFARELPRLFDDYPRSPHPRDRRFAPILDKVGGLARENNLALLNLAAACLEGDEAYVEIGVFHGASLIAAMLGNEGKRFLGVDSFAFRDASLEKVHANLARFGLTPPEIVVGDAFELVPAGALRDVPIGIWYYDAAHSYEAALGLSIAAVVRLWGLSSPPSLAFDENYYAKAACIFVGGSDRTCWINSPRTN